MAENGQEALDILTECGPDLFDLVLMDVQMPIMDGITATRMLRSRPEFALVPIVGMTAHTMTHEQKICAQAGMNDHIGKPFDNASFYSTLARWIPREKHDGLDLQEISTKPQPQPPHTKSRNDINALRGIDAQAAISRLGGREDRYRYWLAEFAAMADEIPDTIRSDLKAGRREAAAITAHTFKGRVGTLGMTELHALVQEMEQALRDGSPAGDLLARLEQSIIDMRDVLKRFLG